jgi:hypothetical protein
MRHLGMAAAVATWAGLLRVLGAGWVAQRRADRLDARQLHADRMRALGHAVTPPR